MEKPRIFVIEDEPDLRELLEYNLHKDGYTVNSFASGEEFSKELKAEPPALLLVDIMLPGIDGFALCRELKRRTVWKEVPIIILTARGEEADIVAGLELGADDYITKPFSPKVLLARVRSVLRRAGARGGGVDESVISRGALLVDTGRHEVQVTGVAVELTGTEFRTLELLARNCGRVFTRSQIVLGVHGTDYPVTERSVDVQIVGLRKKLGSAAELIETVRGVGYRFREE